MMELLLAMMVHSAGIQDRAGAKASLVRLLLRFACLKAPPFVDGGYTGTD